MNTIADNLATALRHRLDEMGRTQGSLARQVGTTQKHLSQMLNGRVKGSIDMWDRLFNALDETAWEWEKDA